MRTALITLALASSVSAETSTSATEFTIDGKTYLKEYVWDDSGVSTEALYVKNDTGEWAFVASLYSDVDANWTGRIGNELYADQWDETVQDYVVVVGAKTWPTWSDFEAALVALHFWDDGGVIDIGYFGDDGIYYDVMVLSAFSVESNSGVTTQVTATEARPGQEGLLLALSKVSTPKARVALMTVLTNPTPKSVFPALAKSGNKSSRAKK